MSQLIHCKSVSKNFGAQRLFQDVDLVVAIGDRIGVIGPNGSGKSTLLKILCDLETADSGEVVRRKLVSLSYLAQSDSFEDDESIEWNLLVSLQGQELEEAERYNRVHSILSRAEFGDPAKDVRLLSGGWRKRLSICRALLQQPDILVMDEPTNHLDIEGILWLEKMLLGGNAACTYLLVSHDRHFLETCTNRIVELSPVYPQGTLQVNGNYSKFLEERETVLAGQLQEEVKLANKARREIEWLRRGPKARATKAKYRIEEAYKLTEDLKEVKSRNNALSSVQIDFAATGRKTKKLLEARGISKAYDGKLLFDDLDIILSPGFRLGLLGRNGCGKSTLMKILAGAVEPEELGPDSGDIKCADKIKVVSFEQDRASLDPELTLRRALAPDGDSVLFRGSALHVVSWAKKFLFRPDQLETNVGSLSGGEQARILIASLMRQPADILLLDEPTNDLDIESLDVLEAGLLDFPGAVVLVTHDRYLLDRICNRILGFGGSSGVCYYSDYLQWLADLVPVSAPKKKKKEGARGVTQAEPGNKKGKLSYLAQREYDGIEDAIGELEQRVTDLQAEMEKPEVLADSERLSECWQQLETARAEVDLLYGRWDELEEMKNG